MRMLLDFRFPLEPFNTLVKKGKAGEKIQQVLEDIKPEAVYFSERDGKRGGIMVVDVPDPSRIPGLAEPLFLAFDASVEFRILMAPEDLAKSGIDDIGTKYS